MFRCPTLRTVLLTSVMALVLVSFWGCGSGDDSAYITEIDTWHAERVDRLRSETGWLSLVGLHPLGQGINILGSAAEADVKLGPLAPAQLGTIVLTGERADFQAHGDVSVHLFSDGAPAEAVFAGGAIQTDGQGAPDMLATGSLIFYVIQRGEKYFLRVKDRQSEVLLSFQGIDRYPVDAKWRVKARLEGPVGTVRVANVLGQVAAEPTPGTLVFEVSGLTHRLVPTGKPGEGLFVVFGDASNGHGTYPGGRFLVTDPPNEEGEVVLDFNRAYNPPCVFTEFATCPLPGSNNMLLLDIAAGEKMWGTGH